MPLPNVDALFGTAEDAIPMVLMPKSTPPSVDRIQIRIPAVDLFPNEINLFWFL